MSKTPNYWWAGEQAIPLALAPQHLPVRGDGRRVSVATVYRWTTAGVSGVRLRRFRGGGRGWCTTVEELQRLLAALTALAGEAP
jgi:hypothetical protein